MKKMLNPKLPFQTRKNKSKGSQVNPRSPNEMERKRVNPFLPLTQGIYPTGEGITQLKLET